VRVVVAGGSGFLGSHLRRRLVEAGHTVVQLVRREPASADQRRWAPDRSELDPAVLAGAGAVVNLAGAKVRGGLWSPSYRQRQRSSRIEPTGTLAAALAALPAADRPPVWLNGSGVGFYGDTGDRAVDESAPPGTGFFPELAQAWEAATAPAAEAGVRVVRLRTGLPLARDGGLLGPLVLPTRLAGGARLGRGRQWMPWLSMRDWLSAVMFLLDHEVAGPVNVVGPDPVRNADFTRTLARALHRPAPWAVPAFALRLGLRDFADETLHSHRALPRALTDAGFTFADTDLDATLRRVLVRPRPAPQA
jgi:uncharacterized protein